VLAADLFSGLVLVFRASCAARVKTCCGTASVPCGICEGRQGRGQAPALALGPPPARPFTGGIRLCYLSCAG
jgi:hypothetical protein